MNPQKSDSKRGSILKFFMVLILLGIFTLPTSALASSPKLDRAFGELKAERYDKALELLDRALPAARTASERAKIGYYRGFALEKLGRCESAELAYRRVLDVQSGTKLATFARDALEGFGARCVAATPTTITDSKTVELPRGSGRVGWKVFGWTTMIVGGLTLAALPIKQSLERDITSQAEPYFSLQYNCDVESGSISGERCDREGLEKDKAYLEYDESLATADRWSNVMLYTGAGLAGLGATTLLLVAFTRPDAPDVALSVQPTSGGAYAGATFRF